MKNREKYREEIVKAIEDCDSCEFMIKTVNPVYSDGWECNDELCQRDECEACLKLFAFWLDEEYEEPPKQEVNWYHVPVDTLVRVRDRLNEDWKLAFFKGFYPHKQFKFATWTNAETSKTGYDYEVWMFCELVEDEDDGSN